MRIEDERPRGGGTMAPRETVGDKVQIHHADHGLRIEIGPKNDSYIVIGPMVLVLIFSVIIAILYGVFQSPPTSVIGHVLELLILLIGVYFIPVPPGPAA